MFHVEYKELNRGDMLSINVKKANFKIELCLFHVEHDKQSPYNKQVGLLINT